MDCSKRKRKRYKDRKNETKKFRRGRCLNCFSKDCLSIQDHQYVCGKLIC